MRIMIGCMIESSLLCTAAAHLGALVDYLDLDGPLLIGNDPFEGMKIEKGRITLPTAPGLGVRLR
jgi:L-alanine-DL-glutamate epimerase-like enolase superfamily enzyme